MMCVSFLLTYVRAEMSLRTVNIAKELLCLLAVLVAAPAMANADAPKGEWRLLGPAWSTHDSLSGAPWLATGRAVEACSLGGSGLDTIRQCTQSEQAVSIPPSHPGSNCYTTALGFPRCNFYVAIYQRRWNGQNPAVGLEYTQRHADHSERYFLNFVRDSYGQSSAMVGAAWEWPLVDRRIRVDAGVGAMLWYRTQDESMVRGLVPVVLPVLSISDRASGLGANLGLVPMVKLRGRQLSVVTLTLQTTYRFK